MYPHRKIVCTLLVLLLAAAWSIPALAAPLELELDAETATCLSAETFSDGASALSGIYVSAVPAAAVCEIRLGQRCLRAGDVLPAGALNALTVTPTGGGEAECALYYRPIYSNGVGVAQELRLSLLRGKNQAPSALDTTFETYKNLSNTGTLSVSDPDGDALTFTLVREPKRGTVELHDDGTFTYTPLPNKVGRDSFTFTASDAAGNVSNEASVKIRIVKPTDKAVYADLPDTAQYVAFWLREKGVYSGRTVAGALCFAPEETLSRGEFLVMAMHLFGEAPESAALTSGFADEAATPGWMQPYIVSALRGGFISGSNAESGAVFRPSDPLTRAEAAVMLQSLARLPLAESRAVFSEADQSDIPVWAVRAAGALESVGLRLDLTDPDAPLTRLEAASLLYQLYPLAQQESR